MMTGIREVEEEALRLSVHDRAQLAARLLETLSEGGYDVSDEEVLLRDEELESGAVQPISHQAFVQYFQNQRKDSQ